jgi:hypothetical protein
MKTNLLMLCAVLTLLLAGCVQNVPIMNLQHNAAPNETKLQNKGNLKILAVNDQRDVKEKSVTQFKDTVILSGQTAPPTTDFVKETLKQEIEDSGLFKVTDEIIMLDEVYLKNGSIIKGQITDTVMEGDSLQSIQILNDMGTIKYEGSNIERIEKSQFAPYELSVVLKSAKVLKFYSPSNYVYVVPAGVLMIIGSATTGIGLMLAGMCIQLVGQAAIPDSYQSTMIMDVTLTKNGQTVYQEEITSKYNKSQSQYGGLKSKVQRGSVVFDTGLTTAIRDMIAKINDKI